MLRTEQNAQSAGKYISGYSEVSQRSFIIPAGPEGCTGTMVGRPLWYRSCQTLPSEHHWAVFPLCVLLVEPSGVDPWPGHRDADFKMQTHLLIDVLGTQATR